MWSVTAGGDNDGRAGRTAEESFGGRQLLEADRSVRVRLDCEQVGDTRGWEGRRKEANV